MLLAVDAPGTSNTNPVFFVDRIVAGASVGILTSLEERVKSCATVPLGVYR